MKIALVVSGKAGDQLLFGYPADTKVKRREEVQYATFHRMNLKDFSHIFCAKHSALTHKVLQVTIDDTTFISQPTPIASDGDISFFNVVFLVDASNSLVKDSDVYHRLSSTLTKALLHEQKRCKFVSREVQCMIRAKEELLASQRSSGVSVSVASDMLLTSELMRMISQTSLLAQHLRDIRDDMVRNGTCQLLLNGWCGIHFSIEDPSIYPVTPIRPYQTVLLTTRVGKLLESLPKDCSPLLRTFLQHANPCRSFHDLELTLGLPIHQLFRLAAHLVYWGKAKIIDTISREYVYVVGPSFSRVDIGSEMAAEFAQRFPRQNLPEVMTAFCVQKPLNDHLKRLSQDAKRNILQILIWLFQHSLVIQLRTYVYVSPTEGAVEASAASTQTTTILGALTAGSRTESSTEATTAPFSSSPSPPTSTVNSYSSSPVATGAVAPRAGTRLQTPSTPGGTISSRGPKPRARWIDDNAEEEEEGEAPPLSNEVLAPSRSQHALAGGEEKVASSGFGFGRASRSSQVSNNSNGLYKKRPLENAPKKQDQKSKKSSIQKMPTLLSRLLNPSEYRRDRDGDMGAGEFATALQDKEHNGTISGMGEPPKSTAKVPTAAPTDKTPLTNGGLSSGGTAVALETDQRAQKPAADSTEAGSLENDAQGCVRKLSSTAAEVQTRVEQQDEGDDTDPLETLFQRLLPYFDGKHHLTEICWRENISMSDLVVLIELNAHKLITVTHEGWSVPSHEVMTNLI